MSVQSEFLKSLFDELTARGISEDVARENVTKFQSQLKKKAELDGSDRIDSVLSKIPPASIAENIYNMLKAEDDSNAGTRTEVVHIDTENDTMIKTVKEGSDSVASTSAAAADPDDNSDTESSEACSEAETEAESTTDDVTAEDSSEAEVIDEELTLNPEEQEDSSDEMICEISEEETEEDSDNDQENDDDIDIEVELEIEIGDDEDTDPADAEEAPFEQPDDTYDSDATSEEPEPEDTTLTDNCDADDTPEASEIINENEIETDDSDNTDVADDTDTNTDNSEAEQDSENDEDSDLKVFVLPGDNESDLDEYTPGSKRRVHRAGIHSAAQTPPGARKTVRRTSESIDLFEDDSDKKNGWMFYVFTILIMPLAVIVGAFVFAVFVAMWLALAVLSTLLIVGVFVIAAAGALVSICGLLFGLIELIGGGTAAAMFEIGLALIIGAAVMFVGILIYNVAMRLVPYIIKKLGTLLVLIFKTFVKALRRLRKLCDSI